MLRRFGVASEIRPGIIASVLLTVILSLSTAYLSVRAVKEPLYLSLGLTLSAILISVSALVLKGNYIALVTLSIFYFVMSFLGLLMIPSLPSEGTLLFFFSLSLGTYLLRYRDDPFRRTIEIHEGVPPIKETGDEPSTDWCEEKSSGEEKASNEGNSEPEYHI